MFVFFFNLKYKADVSAKSHSHSISTPKAISQLHNTKNIHHHQRNTRSSPRQNEPRKQNAATAPAAAATAADATSATKQKIDQKLIGNGGNGLSTNNHNLINKKSSSKHVTANIEEIRIGNYSGADEARYNLATRVMSNGVEVIVASDKSTLPGGQPNLRILSTGEHYRMPLTLAPSTLKDHMLLVVPTDDKHNNINKQSNYVQASQVFILIIYC